jgi:hypothetical protein
LLRYSEISADSSPDATDDPPDMIPMVVELTGTKITFPDGVNTPPAKALIPAL